MRVRFVALALLLFAVAPAAAEPAEQAAPGSRTAGFLRAHWDYPAKASLGFGLIARRSAPDCSSTCLYQGLTLQGAGGMDAGELAVGYGRLVGEAGSNRWLLSHTYVGYGVRAAALRTWGGTTYLGVEGGFTVAQFGLRVGVFRGVESATDRRGWRVFGGAGWGF